MFLASALNTDEIKVDETATPILDARKLFMLKDDDTYRFIWENIDFSLAFEDEEDSRLEKALEFRYWSIMEEYIAKDVRDVWVVINNRHPKKSKRQKLKLMAKSLRKNAYIKFNVPTVVMTVPPPSVCDFCVVRQRCTLKVREAPWEVFAESMTFPLEPSGVG